MNFTWSLINILDILGKFHFRWVGNNLHQKKTSQNYPLQMSGHKFPVISSAELYRHFGEDSLTITTIWGDQLTVNGFYNLPRNMDVSLHGGTPKSSISIGFSI